MDLIASEKRVADLLSRLEVIREIDFVQKQIISLEMRRLALESYEQGYMKAVRQIELKRDINLAS